MKRILARLPAAAKPDEATAASASAGNWPEAAPAKKRGLFMAPKFFGGKEAEAAPRNENQPTEKGTGENPGQPDQPAPGPETAISKGNGAAEKPADTLSATAAAPAASETGLVLPKTNPAASAPAEPVAPDKSDTLAGALASSAAPVIPASAAPVPGGGHASAQLTLGFKIAALQLSPFFKLASMRLKAISNVASLHLVAGQAANAPLAAGISFQIERAEMDGASRLKSLLLKPLGEARKLAEPLSQVRVDGWSLDGGEGSPIALTTAAEIPTVVHLFGTFVITGMEFTPAFEIGALQIEAASPTVFVGVDPASHPAGGTPPPAFEITEVELDADKQITGVSVATAATKRG